MNRANAMVIGSEISPSFLGLVHEAAELCGEKGLSLTAVIVSAAEPDNAGQLIYAGAERTARLALSVLDINAEAAAAESIAQYARSVNPEFILFESSSFFCCTAPMTAAKLNCGITADCTALSWAKNGTLRQTRPAFGGRKLAHIENTHLPVLATVRKGVFKLSASDKAPSIEMPLLPCCEVHRVWTRTRVLEESALGVDLTGAEIIVSGGLGMGSRESFKKLYTLAELLGAAVGASRAAVAAGFADYSHQVGQTGVSVRPDVYLAFGISGAVQHLSGISGAKKIYAVNLDPKAPIHEYADYSVIADCVSVIDMLIEKAGNKKC